jgi:DDE superfamily endonuclease
MLPSSNLPVSFVRVLSPLRQCFSVPTYQVFVVLFCGFVSAVGDHTVTGMLVASGYSTTWSHHRAHRFFSRARWCADAVGMAVLDLIVHHLLPVDGALELVVDDSLFKRSGPRVWGVFWHHDATSTSSKPVAKGTCYILVGVVVNVRFMTRAICLPVHVRLWTPKPKTSAKKRTGTTAGSKASKNCPSKVEMAKAAVLRIADRYPERTIHVTGDAAYISRSLRKLPAGTTWTSRLRSNAALFDFAPPKTGLRGRPKTKGERLPALSEIAKNAKFTTRQVHRYNTDGAADTTMSVEVHAFKCLWYGVLATEIVKVVMVRDVGKDSYGIAIVSTDLEANDVQLIERYARRWSIEVTFEEGKGIAGVADARNRTRKAVQRTVPFGFYSMSILVVWFATSGVDHDAIVAERRRIAPWYTAKTTVSFADILNMARRVLTASQFRPTPSSEPNAQEIEIIRLASDDLAA